MQYLHQNTLFCWFSLETSRIGNINLKRREICHIPLPEAHVEWDHCDPDILSGLLVYVAQLKPGVVLKSTVSSSGGWGQDVEKDKGLLTFSCQALSVSWAWKGGSRPSENIRNLSNSSCWGRWDRWSIQVMQRGWRRCWDRWFSFSDNFEGIITWRGLVSLVL